MLVSVVWFGVINVIHCCNLCIFWSRNVQYGKGSSTFKGMCPMHLDWP
uniref:Uncharacterized protein n=1 Tax=Arundo donax TaxID=35708 RepID=A0A0A8Z8B4_ARUDO